MYLINSSTFFLSKQSAERRSPFSLQFAVVFPGRSQRQLRFCPDCATNSLRAPINVSRKTPVAGFKSRYSFGELVRWSRGCPQSREKRSSPPRLREMQFRRHVRRAIVSRRKLRSVLERADNWPGPSPGRGRARGRNFPANPFPV